MTQARFHNALRVLYSIDYVELEDVLSGFGWAEFCKDPAKFVIRCDDATWDAIWAIIEERCRAQVSDP